MDISEKVDITSLLNLPLTELISQANKIRKDFIGNKLELCSIVNAKSGLCSEDCKFCAQSSRHKTDVSTYPLKNATEIKAGARKAKEIGAEKFGIVTSGNRLTTKELDIIIHAITEIKREVGITICASLGALKKNELEKLKEAGLSRYHHNIETSPRFYPDIISTHGFEERIDTIKAAREVGLEVCSGGIIGMGETWEDRIDMAHILQELGVDSVPLNILVPIKNTPLESIIPLSSEDAIRTICLFRIILKGKVLKIAAGRESILKDFQATAFMAGANGMLIGGYLTVKGRDIESDWRLIKEIKELWKE